MEANQTITQAARTRPEMDAEIRSATREDARAAAALIYLPMVKLAHFLFGTNEPATVREILEKLFIQQKNRFSYQFCDVAEASGQVAGLLLSYPARTLSELSLPMAGQLLQILGWTEMVQFVERTWPLMRVGEAEPDEYYIFTLAVAPAVQSRGIGSRLLEQAEIRARFAGLSKCSLGVDVENERARRFYQRHGYRTVGTVETPRIEQVCARMVKSLGHSSS